MFAEALWTAGSSAQVVPVALDSTGVPGFNASDYVLNLHVSFTATGAGGSVQFPSVLHYYCGNNGHADWLEGLSGTQSIGEPGTGPGDGDGNAGSARRPAAS